MATSTIFALMDAVESGLEAHFDANSLADVQVFTMTLGEVPGEFIAFSDWRVDQERMAMGGSRLESYEVEGKLRIMRPQNSEAGAEAARNRAKTIFAAVENYLRSDNTIAGAVLDCQLTKFSVLQGAFPTGERVCDIDFTLFIRAAI